MIVLEENFNQEEDDTIRTHYILQNVYFNLVIHTFQRKDYSYKPISTSNPKERIIMKQLLYICDALALLSTKPIRLSFEKIPYILDSHIETFLSRIYDEFFKEDITWSKIIIFLVFWVKVGLNSFKIKETYHKFFNKLHQKLEPWILQNSGWESFPKEFDIEEFSDNIKELQQLDFRGILYYERTRRLPGT